MESDERGGLANAKEQPLIKGDIFPKKIGIVFIERIQIKRSLLKGTTEEGSNPRLNFDQVACAHLVLQMNTIQSTFEFQIVIPKLIKEFSFQLLPTENNNKKNSRGDKKKNSPMLDWFDNQVKIILDGSETAWRDIEYLRGIDYWIGITSEPIIHDWSFEGQTRDKTKSGKYIGIITSVDWEKAHSPPSLFEYIASSILLCSLYFINREFGGKLYFHSLLITKGCIFDFTGFKPHRRIDVSNPHLCGTCKEKLRELETKIFESAPSRIHIYNDIHRILSRKWMGDPEKRDSPLYNLNKNYKYNVDRHSGFYKTPWERFRDSLEEKSAEWTVGGIATAAFALLVAYLSARFGLGH